MMAFSPKNLVQSKKGDNNFHHYFIPNQGNNHRPAVLNPRALKVYSTLLILVKLAVTSFLFLSYPDEAFFSSITRGKIIQLTNQERAAQGLSLLTENSILNQAATAKANDMIANNYFAHTSPDGVSPWYWFKSAGYIYTNAGENLAMDFTDAEGVMAAWMVSPTHKKNIVSDKYKEIGVAVVTGQIDGRDTILCVQFFGTTYVPPVEEPEAELPPTSPTPTPEPTPEPAPTPTPAPVVPAPESLPESYSAELVSQSYQKVNIQAGQAITFWAEFKNTGTVSWRNSGGYYIALNVSNPTGRVSEFQHPYWNEVYYRTTRLDTDTITPGATGRFTFALQAPEQPGDYQESFNLVAENVAFIPGGSLSIPITVTPLPIVESAIDVEPDPAPLTPQEEVIAPFTPEEETTINTNQSTVNTNTTQTTSTQVVAELKAADSENLVDKIINFTKRFYEIFLAFIIIALLLNILIKVKIQHAPVIFQTILVIGLTLALLLARFHFLERIPEIIKII